MFRRVNKPASIIIGKIKEAMLTRTPIIIAVEPKPESEYDIIISKYPHLWRELTKEDFNMGHNKYSSSSFKQNRRVQLKHGFKSKGKQ